MHLPTRTPSTASYLTPIYQCLSIFLQQNYISVLTAIFQMIVWVSRYLLKQRTMEVVATTGRQDGHPACKNGVGLLVVTI